MDVLGIGAVMMLPMIALGVTLILSHEATKEIGNDVDL
jgi:hypothetical protein